MSDAARRGGARGDAEASPRERFVLANRLSLHLVEWGRPDGVRPPVLLLHGFLEHAHAWDFVAPRLADAGHHVLALDWRGHGDSERVGPGGYYHFADYVADLACVVRALGGRAALVGHSMGGNAALLYAGTEPDRVSALASIEGLGPPGADPLEAPGRFAGWIHDLARAAGGAPQPFTLEEATARLRERFPLFSDEVVRHMARFGTRAAGTAVGAAPAGARSPGASAAGTGASVTGIETSVTGSGAGVGGTERSVAGTRARVTATETSVTGTGASATGTEAAPRVWKFDPRYRTRAPQPFYVAQAAAFWRRIACRVLYVGGGQSALSLPAEEIAARTAALRAPQVVIEPAGHHPHLETPAELTAILAEFLSGSR